MSIIDTLALGEPRVVAAYLVTGKERALIDMGYRSSADSIINDISSAGVDTIDYLLPTHVHLDHAGSCGTLAKRFPEAAVLAHPIGEKHLVNPERLIEDAGALFGDLIRQYGFPEPIASSRVRNLDDGELIRLGDGQTLRSVWTPGHASHHLSFLLESTRTLFTGDCVGVYWPDIPVLIPTTPPSSFNLDKALVSLSRVRALNPSELCTPHFGVIREPDTWLDLNQQNLLDWKKTIARMLSEGKSVDSIAREVVSQLNEPHKIPAQLPIHLQTLIRVDILGFIRWLRYSQMSSKTP